MAERIFSRPRALRSAGAALLALALGGCADQARHREVELQELVGMFAGQYDNIAQVRQLNAQGNGEREALVMLIVPVHAPLIGDNVFLVQESAANDPRRLISQQLASLQVAAGEPVLVETQLALTEPGRWREAGRNPDVFKSLLPQDVKLMGGYEITWRKVAGGFDGSTDVTRCRVNSRTTGEGLRVDQRLQLRADSIHRVERQVDATGHLMQGGGDDPGYNFQRRAD